MGFISYTEIFLCCIFVIHEQARRHIKNSRNFVYRQKEWKFATPKFRLSLSLPWIGHDTISRQRFKNRIIIYCSRSTFLFYTYLINDTGLYTCSLFYFYFFVRSFLHAPSLTPNTLERILLQDCLRSSFFFLKCCIQRGWTDNLTIFIFFSKIKKK